LEKIKLSALQEFKLVKNTNTKKIAKEKENCEKKEKKNGNGQK